MHCPAFIPYRRTEWVGFLTKQACISSLALFCSSVWMEALSHHFIVESLLPESLSAVVEPVKVLHSPM